jgi:hypothetical protein
LFKSEQRFVYSRINLKIKSRRYGYLWGLIILAMVTGYYAWRDYTKAEVVVEWSTASELSTVGFNLYRSDLIDGSYVKVNDELIPASPDPLIGGKYTFNDERVSAGETYYYQLEEVESDGNTSRYGPIEVNAQRGGFVELLLMLSLLVTGVFVVYSLLRHRNIQDGLHQE